MKLRPLGFPSALSPCHPGYFPLRMYAAEGPLFVSGVALAEWPEGAVGQCAAGSSEYVHPLGPGGASSPLLSLPDYAGSGGTPARLRRLPDFAFCF